VDPQTNGEGERLVDGGGKDRDGAGSELVLRRWAVERGSGSVEERRKEGDEGTAEREESRFL
jgi:hypothetical protein